MQRFDCLMLRMLKINAKTGYNDPFILLYGSRYVAIYEYLCAILIPLIFSFVLGCELEHDKLAGAPIHHCIGWVDG
jgi:hypothetical protein